MLIVWGMVHHGDHCHNMGFLLPVDSSRGVNLKGTFTSVIDASRMNKTGGGVRLRPAVGFG